MEAREYVEFLQGIAKMAKDEESKKVIIDRTRVVWSRLMMQKKSWTDTGAEIVALETELATVAGILGITL